MELTCNHPMPLVGRFSDIATETHTKPTPIEGLEITPLVSLQQSIEPLIPIVHGIQQKARMVANICKHPADDLSCDESAAIMLYTLEWESNADALYFILNSILRAEDTTKLKPWFLYLKLLLTALHRLPKVGNRTVYRGIKLNMAGMFPVNSTHTWWAFSSCTTTINTLEEEQFFGKSGTRTLFTIECFNGRDIRQHSYIKRENEILLLPGTQLKVVACLTPSTDFNIIQLKEVESSFSLLKFLTNTQASVAEHQTAESSKHSLPHLNIRLFMDLVSRKTHESHHNLKLEKLITKCNSGSLIDLDRQSLHDQDMPFIVTQALIHKECAMLRLSDNKITSKGASILADSLHNNKTLVALHIFNNRLGDTGVKALTDVLAENTSTVKVLSLGYNGITDKGVECLADLLKKNKTLTELWLPWNQISDRGVALLADVLIDHNTTLKKLVLNLNDLIHDSSVDSLVDIINRNQSLDVLHVCDCKLSKTGKAKLSEKAKSKTNFELSV